MNSLKEKEFIYGSIFFFILLCTTYLYWTGLKSIFVFDDIPNLRGLANITGSNETLISIGQFITEGVSSRTGRPISLLTFAAQHENWMLYPWRFKYVNLLIHLINGCLIFWFILLLTRILKFTVQRSLLFACLISAIWLMHPIHVSTVLYVVQRMTELSALFTLAGLIAYLKGRQYFEQNETTKGFILISLGIGLGGILATLSKENGILIALYVIVLEATVLQTLSRPQKYWRTWFSIFVIAPLILLALYLTINFNGILSSYSIRDFTMGERLLTQTRALWDYVAKIFLLNHHFSLFHDDFPISHSLFMPLTTFVATCGLIFAFFAALRFRRIYPIFALGVLWFLAGHVLESSFIGLIRYFEHRNYLPSLGIIFAAIYGATYLLERMRIDSLRKISITLSVLWMLAFPLITLSQTNLWARPFVQAALWAEDSPSSRYAVTHAASLFEQLGEYAKAEAYYRHLTKVLPDNAGPYMLWLMLACKYEEVTFPNVETLIHSFETKRTDTATVAGLNEILMERSAGRCDLSHELLVQIMDALTEKNQYRAYKGEFYYLYALFHAVERRYHLALEKLEKAKDKPYIRMERIAWLIVEERWEEALFHLHKTRKEMNLFSLRLYGRDLDDFEKIIKSKINEQLPNLGQGNEQ